MTAVLTEALLFLPLTVVCFGLYVMLCHRLARPIPGSYFSNGALQPRFWVIGLGWNVLGLVCWVSYPLARLEILDQGVRIAPNKLIARPLVPTWELTWTDLAELQDGRFYLSIAVKSSRGKLRILPRSPDDKKQMFQGISVASQEFRSRLSRPV